jgi:hypothetical protein
MSIKKGPPMGTTVWVALIIVGTAFLLSKQLAGHNVVTWALVRLSALCYLAAGVVGAGGWFGRWMEDLVSWTIRTGQDIGVASVGTKSFLGIVVLVGAIGFLLALLPDSWWGGQMPDWGSVCGAILPALAVSIPGPIGEWLRDDVFPALATPLVNLARSALGV